MYIAAGTLDDLLRRVFRKILDHGRRIRPSRGPATELTAVSLHLTNPRARLSRSESRGRVFSALGELLWYLARSGDVKFISYYIPLYAESSDDGKTIHGAYGPRLFTLRGINQVANIIRLLRTRADSRRAVIQLFDAADVLKSYKDVPCTCTMQFMLRDGHLDMIASMRSNDAYLGLPHDVFTFTMLLELIARSVGVEVGGYHHVVGSLHLYDEHRKGARQYLREGWQATKPMPPMPLGQPWPSVDKVLKAERAIRQDKKMDAMRLLPYWKDLLLLLRILRMERAGRPEVVAQLGRRMRTRVFAPYIFARQQRAARPETAVAARSAR
jgi:thymidylate synthase